MTVKAREAWRRLYSKHGLQFGGGGDLGLMAPLLKQGMLVLDAGCGDGKTAEILARRVEVVGCDFSHDALLSLRLQRDRDFMVNLVECELCYLPFGDEKFNAVVSVHSLSHLTERERPVAAKEMVRTLAPGGLVFVEVFDMEDFRSGEGEEVEKGSFLRGNGIVTHYFESGELPDLFRGMERVNEASHSKRVSFGARSGKRSILRVLLKKPECTKASIHVLRSDDVFSA